MRSPLNVSLALAVLCGCASAPKIDYYTLAMEPSGRARPAVNLVVDRLHTTEALARRQILIHTSATTIEYYAAAQWVGGVDKLVRQKLVVEFGPPLEGRRTLIVSGVVLAFEQVDVAGGADARMRLHAEVRDAASKRYEPPLLEKTYVVTRSAAGRNPAAVVQALSRCVEDIAAEIATDVSNL